MPKPFFSDMADTTLSCEDDTKWTCTQTVPGIIYEILARRIRACSRYKGSMCVGLELASTSEDVFILLHLEQSTIPKFSTVILVEYLIYEYARIAMVQRRQIIKKIDADFEPRDNKTLWYFYIILEGYTADCGIDDAKVRRLQLPILFLTMILQTSTLRQCTKIAGLNPRICNGRRLHCRLPTRRKPKIG